MELILTSQYGVLSRGRHSARKGKGDNVQWADKDSNGNLVITESGTWNLHCSDGYNRDARAVLTVNKDGSYSMSGDTKRFNVL